jgi:hypothetical protein
VWRAEDVLQGDFGSLQGPLFPPSAALFRPQILGGDWLHAERRRRSQFITPPSTGFTTVSSLNLPAGQFPGFYAGM